jgi:hypothetical protein
MVCASVTPLTEPATPNIRRMKPRWATSAEGRTCPQPVRIAIDDANTAANTPTAPTGSPHAPAMSAHAAMRAAHPLVAA